MNKPRGMRNNWKTMPPQDGGPDRGPAFFKDDKERASYKKIMLPLKLYNDDGGTVPCQQDPEFWWSDSREEQLEAAAICRTCPMQDPCAEWAIKGKERSGVWGGMTAAERQSVVTFNKRNPDRPRLYPKADPKRRPENRLPDMEDPGVPEGMAWDDERHGLVWTYNNPAIACRCQRCRAAKSATRRINEQD